jgi:tetratricopeptide (TPR) repeat protein
MRCSRPAVAVLLFLLSAVPAAGQGGAIRGSVEDIDGRPIKGATITAINPAGRPAQLTATTDDKGRFALIGLVGGVWNFVADAPGFVRQQGSARVRSTTLGNPPIEFVLPKAELPPPGLVNKQVQSDVLEADEFRKNGRWDQAIAAYQAVAEKNPALTTVHLVIGDVYRQKAAQEASPAARQPLYDRAIAAYQQVLKADPENARARLEVAMTLLQKGSVQDADRALAAAAAAATADAPILYGMGEIRMAAEDLAGAEQMFQRAVAADPSWLRPKVKLGLVAYRSGKKAEAIEAFNAVVAADAASPEAAEAAAFLRELQK